MLLGADRLHVVEGERIHAVLIVSTPMVSILALGGLDRLRHELEDLGFRDVQLLVDRPSTWRGGAEVTRPGDLEWLLLAELVPMHSTSFQRQLTSELRLAVCWDARLDGERAVPAFHPYAAHFCAVARFAGALRAYAIAYVIGGLLHAVDRTLWLAHIDALLGNRT
jgi:hypothetical protein